ncbi:hypothetical protein [Novosphingobium sp. M1R2S20]|uniref:Uncharacterized protein n=1 Tax=Novosphingobium rhizovicinum TaxID=3228928 RepID=A0ABV3RAJ4_9SPHN
MAFIDFRDDAPPACPAFALAPSQSVALAAQTLTELERRVIDLARGDGLSSLRAQRKRSWLVRLILGPQPPSPVLANERLEALRRLAVQAWHHGYQLPASALKEAQEAGYTDTQIGAAVDLIVRLRQPTRRSAA